MERGGVVRAVIIGGCRVGGCFLVCRLLVHRLLIRRLFVVRLLAVWIRGRRLRVRRHVGLLLIDGLLIGRCLIRGLRRDVRLRFRTILRDAV